jgi:hypothetical protein
MSDNNSGIKGWANSWLVFAWELLLIWMVFGTLFKLMFSPNPFKRLLFWVFISLSLYVYCSKK